MPDPRPIEDIIAEAKECLVPFSDSSAVARRPAAARYLADLAPVLLTELDARQEKIERLTERGIALAMAAGKETDRLRAALAAASGPVLPSEEEINALLHKHIRTEGGYSYGFAEAAHAILSLLHSRIGAGSEGSGDA